MTPTPPSMNGSYKGTAVPPVGGISYGSYTQPANWQNPVVYGTDLAVHRDVLRQVASEIGALAGELQAAIGSWQPNAAAAAGAVGAWPEAVQFDKVIGRSSGGFGEYSGNLRDAHSDTATRITISADRYDSAEQANVTLVNASYTASGIVIENGGNNVPLDPGYGQNWTPQQREAYARTQRLINMNGGQQNWTGAYPITDGAGFAMGKAATGYTWQEVQALLGATDPAAVSAAGAAYGQLANKLSDVAGKVAQHGQTLAANWSGATAVTAVSQVQQLYQTAADMQANAWQAQHALTWYGSVLSAFKANLPQPASSHPVDVAAANQAAQQRMAALNGHIQTAYYAMPAVVNKNLPPRLGGSGGGAPVSSGAGHSAGPANGGGSGAGPMPSGGSPGGPGAPGSGFGAPPPGGGPPSSAPPVTSPPPVSRVAGAGPGPGPVPPGGPNPGGTIGGSGGGPVPGGPGVGAVPPPVPGGAPGPEGSPSGGGGTAPGEGGLPGGDPVPVGSVPVVGSPGGVAGTGSSLGSTGAVSADPAGSAGSAVSGGPGMAGEAGAGNVPEGAMFPMAGSAGGGGAGTADRTRESWMPEDQGVWGSEDGVAGAGEPAGLFMPVGPGGGQSHEQERARQSWMDEDDLWGAREPAVAPVIGG
ncbi:MAG TPA: hypothetical protein VGS19_37910 [Streptosporangiaceae bacterium]|nr:hypothetical protein [Streptosporangiaceae bacterium]